MVAGQGLFCVSPSFATSQSAIVEISLNARQFTTNKLPYVHLHPLKISSLSPNSGPTIGGTLVVLTGTDLSNGANTEDLPRCIFDDSQTIAQYQEETQV